MLPPRRLLPLFATLATLPLTDSGRALGTLLLGAPGAGKTILESLCLLVDLLRGLPGCVLDPLGTLSEAFLFRLGCFLSELPPGDDEGLWQRLRYIELGGDAITPFPIYYQREGESLWDASSRLITVLERANPQLVTGSPLTWPAARRLALNAGMVLTALSLQLDNVADLLFQTIEWEKSGKFDEAIRRNPQAEPAVSYFRNYYLPLPRSEKSRLAGTFLDQVFMLTSEPTLREVFSGASVPGINWEEVEALRQIVILNFKGITNPTARSFAMQWIFESLYPHLKGRGRRTTPFVVTIDEFAHLTTAGMGENKPLAELFDEFLAQYMRNNRVLLTVALQSVDQVDERLQRTLFRLGTLITGRAGSVREARVIADHVFRKDIYRVQHYKKVWGKHDPPPYFSRARDRYEDYRSNAGLYNASYPYFVLDHEPEYMPLENQTEDAAGTIQKLQALEFLCRPALSEGVVSQDVLSLSIADALRDPDTDEYIFPDPEHDAALITQLQHRLAARSGRPVTDSRTEQEALLPTGSPRKRSEPQPAGEVNEKQPSDPRNARETHSLPTLDEDHVTFLTFLIAHPESPVNLVYKEVGIGAAKVTHIRDELKAMGLLVDLDVRTGSSGAGRPTKFLLPTFHAFELLGKDPPSGRGGVIHRAIQHAVSEGALAKGYNTKVEYTLQSGAIVDVHLEKGGEKIAVEIAVMSHPHREVVHMKACLLSGYDKVFGIFPDTDLLARTQEMIRAEFSPDDAAKVRLLPLSMLSQLG